MKLKSAGVLRRIDLAPALDLLPALLREWAELEFDQSGEVINPITGTAVQAFVLIEGGHRRVGSRYVVTIEAPRLELPEERKPEFDEEQTRLMRGERSNDAWRDHFERRRQASVQAGVDRTTVVVTLKGDDPRHIAATLTEARERWEVDVEVTHGRLPQLALTARVDLTAVIKGEGMPGCVARFLGGDGGGRAAIDLTRLEGRGGTVLDATGSANRFRGSARAVVETSAARWSVEGGLTVGARGLGKVVMLVVGRRLRRRLGDGLQRFWRTADERISDAETALLELAAMAEREGGEAAFVRRGLWDSDFDPRPPSARR